MKLSISLAIMLWYVKFFDERMYSESNEGKYTPVQFAIHQKILCRDCVAIFLISYTILTLSEIIHGYDLHG